MAKKITALLVAEAAKPDAQVIPLYEEAGVYNFYLYMGKGSKAEPAEASGLGPLPRPRSAPAALGRNSAGGGAERSNASARPFGRPPQA